MPRLTEAEADTLRAFLDAFDLSVVGVWPKVERSMRLDFGVKDPAAAMEAVRAALDRTDPET